MIPTPGGVGAPRRSIIGRRGRRPWEDNMNEYERVNYARRRGGGGLASSPTPTAGEEATHD